jgi:WD40 repeat protein
VVGTPMVMRTPSMQSPEPDGQTPATAGFDNTVRLWDAATRKETAKYEGHPGGSPSPRAEGEADPRGAWITRRRSGIPGIEPTRRLASRALEALAVKPDGKHPWPLEGGRSAWTRDRSRGQGSPRTYRRRRQAPRR